MCVCERPVIKDKVHLHLYQLNMYLKKRINIIGENESNHPKQKPDVYKSIKFQKLPFKHRTISHTCTAKLNKAGRMNVKTLRQNQQTTNKINNPEGEGQP